jgi:hypothetical protein
MFQEYGQKYFYVDCFKNSGGMKWKTMNDLKLTPAIFVSRDGRNNGQRVLDWH